MPVCLQSMEALSRIAFGDIEWQACSIGKKLFAEVRAWADCWLAYLGSVLGWVPGSLPAVRGTGRPEGKGGRVRASGGYGLGLCRCLLLGVGS